MTIPRVSVGLPVYNGADFIQRAIDTLLRQDFEDFEVIIADNASTDETQSICSEAAAADQRIRYYRNDENIGASANYNKVFQLARAEYFRWQAHDDECHPGLLRRCVETLDASEERVTMCYPRGELIDAEGNTLVSPLDSIATNDPRPHRRLAHVIKSLNMCDPIFGVIKTNHLKQTGLIGPFFGADNVLLGELAILGEIREVDEVLFRLRKHSKRSMKANPSARARAAWYDPSAAKKLFVMPNWERMVLELLKATLRSRLSIAEKTKCCLAIVGTHYWRRVRNQGGRVKARLRRRFGVESCKGAQ
jgi:glycosyltransferase involved in cell wall biosynthesis